MSSHVTQAADAARSVPEKVFSTRQTLVPAETPPYVYHTFQLETAETAPPSEGEIAELTLHFSFFKANPGDGQLFVALFDATGQFRGVTLNPGAVGQVDLNLCLTPTEATEGAIPGPLPLGEWKVLIDVNMLAVPLTYQLDVRVARGDAPAPVALDFPDHHVVKAEAGWYRGELHAHSTESDGKHPVETVVQAAIDAGLDFFSLPDHFTTSQWRKLLPFVCDSAEGQKIALIRSCELTSHHGHANLQGMREWVDIYVDMPSWTMNDAADAIHAQGGLFCVNHPYSGDLGWRTYEFDWSKADLMEVYHQLEGPQNNFQTPLWDRLLHTGHRIVGVGGTDSHDPFEGRHKLGKLCTWVYLDELSEQGLIEGLRRGRVFVSLGPQLRFTARNRQGAIAEMWETLDAEQEPIELNLAIQTDEPVNVFVLRDGLPFAMMPVAPGHEWQTLSFVDAPRLGTYYRAEVHAPPHREVLPEYHYAQWRDFHTFRALTNPIWVRP